MCKIQPFSFNILTRNGLSRQCHLQHAYSLIGCPAANLLPFFQTYNTNEVLKKFYKVLSTNSDGRVEFVSTVEGSYNPASRPQQSDGTCFNEHFSHWLLAAYDYPIYGTQWHPEKNAFEWTRDYIPHSASAVKTTFYTAEFFVSEGKQSFFGFAH